MTNHTPDRDSRTNGIAAPHLENAETTKREITEFIRESVAGAGAEGVVVNLSGGIDSTVSATLAVEALGSDHVYGLVLPANANQKDNIDDARQVAEELVIDHRVIDVQPLLDRFVRAMTSESRETTRDPASGTTQMIIAPDESRERYEAAVGNAAARLRMMSAYFEANTTSRLVLGTGNRTELLLGYFTKYGDGGVDLLPIGDLYKTEVRDLARHLDIRDTIVEKEPTVGLWVGQADEAELGASYGTIDAILYHVVDEGRRVQEVATALDTEPDRVRSYVEMYDRAAHKRAPPPTPDQEST